MSIEIGLLIAVVSFFMGYVVFVRNRDKDVKQDAAKEAVMDVNLKHIKTGVDSIIVDMKVRDKIVDAMSKDLVRVDESTKAAHKRIDKLDGGRGE